eukprot:759732-Hanusia_phi.AAC.1
MLYYLLTRSATTVTHWSHCHCPGSARDSASPGPAGPVTVPYPAEPSPGRRAADHRMIRLSSSGNPAPTVNARSRVRPVWRG